MGNSESSGCLGPCVTLTEQHIVPRDGGLQIIDLAYFKMRALEKRENLDTRVTRYVNALTVSTEALIEMKKAFVHELQLGLQLFRQASINNKNINPKQCSFKMLDSHVKSIPSGEETGTYYALDFGGTNIRAVRLHLKGGSKLNFSQYKSSLSECTSLPKGLMDANASATEMFDFFAKLVAELMKEKKDDKSGLTFGVGFTFSFPCEVKKIDSAILMEWTKDFETGRNTRDKVEGKDVCDMLSVAFKRNDVPAYVAAIMNDTVGTLLSCAYEMDHSKYPQCLVAIILGTGFNACYFDDECQYNNYNGNIINIECGNFNRNLPQSILDVEVDFASANRGSQLLEKMISGAYLGELLRRAIRKVFQHLSPSSAWEPHSLSAKDAAEMASDMSEDAGKTKSLIKSLWNVELPQLDCMYIRRLAYAIFDRSAALAASVVAACAEKTGYLQTAMGGLTVAVDGSLYKCNKLYRKRLFAHLESILGEENAELIHMIIADDGSGKGAAIVASQLGSGNKSSNFRELPT